MEGILRSKELVCYLEKNELPFVVSLSEDATRVTSKVEYDRKTNQITGFVLPTHHKTGMPIPFTYKARNVDEITKHFSRNSDIASLVTVIMAQPMAEKRVPAFCLLVFGSSNTFTSIDVRNRWRYITNELAKLNIKTLAFSSDSDPRYNSCMRNQSFLGSSDRIIDWFDCGIRDGKLTRPFYVQDVTHIGTKLRNYLLNHGEKIPFGEDLYVQMEHLKILVNEFPKDHHNVTSYTLNPTDKQNFESVKRMCSERVTELLRKSIVGSQATIKFLEIMRFIIESYMSTVLSPLQRVSKLWYALFMIRIWRQFIIERKLKLKNNFLTANCYACIELNAHSLVLLITYLKRSKLPQLFKPYDIESQQCEKLFRQIRSFTSTYCTVANVSIKEFMERISKIALQDEIMTDTNDIFKYSRSNSHRTSIPVITALPSLDMIRVTIEKSKQDAIADAINLGLLKSTVTEKVGACLILPLDLTSKKEKRNRSNSVCPKTFSLNQSIIEKNLLKSYASIPYEDNDESSPYVQVKRSNGATVYILKRSICWLLRPDYRKLSADRLVRVRQNNDRKTKKPGKYADEKKY